MELACRRETVPTITTPLAGAEFVDAAGERIMGIEIDAARYLQVKVQDQHRRLLARLTPQPHTRLILLSAPAGYGKTSYALERIRQARAVDPLTPIIVILPNQAQVNAFRHRLSLGGGAMGVNLGTFYTLYPEVLAWAGKPEPRLCSSYCHTCCCYVDESARVDV